MLFKKYSTDTISFQLLPEDGWAQGCNTAIQEGRLYKTWVSSTPPTYSGPRKAKCFL